MDYKNKYLKYKNKYLNLKGGGISETKKKIVDILNENVGGDILTTNIPKCIIDFLNKKIPDKQEEWLSISWDNLLKHDRLQNDLILNSLYPITRLGYIKNIKEEKNRINLKEEQKNKLVIFLKSKQVNLETNIPEELLKKLIFIYYKKLGESNWNELCDNYYTELDYEKLIKTINTYFDECTKPDVVKTKEESESEEKFKEDTKKLTDNENRLSNILTKHNINLDDNIPNPNAADTNTYFFVIKKLYTLLTWRSLLVYIHKDFEYENLFTSIEEYLDKYNSSKSEVIIPTLPEIKPMKLQATPKIPEKINYSNIYPIQLPDVIIPSDKLPEIYDPIYDIRHGSVSAEHKRKYSIYMTHLLFKKKDGNYMVWGLYYHDKSNPIPEQIKMIKELITEKCNKNIEYKKTHKLPEDEISNLQTIINNINSDKFWKDTSRYYIVGELVFRCSNIEMNISSFNTLNLEKGSGLKMLCTTLLFFYKKYPKLHIMLESGGYDVTNKFYKPLGFEDDKLSLREGHLLILNDILPLIQEKCKYCSEDVKLILKNNNEFIDSSEKMIELIN